MWSMWRYTFLEAHEGLQRQIQAFIHTLKVVDLTSKMITYYSDASGVVKYINMLQYVQKIHNGVNFPSLL